MPDSRPGAGRIYYRPIPEPEGEGKGYPRRRIGSDTPVKVGTRVLRRGTPGRSDRLRRSPDPTPVRRTRTARRRVERPGRNASTGIPEGSEGSPGRRTGGPAPGCRTARTGRPSRPTGPRTNAFDASSPMREPPCHPSQRPEVPGNRPGNRPSPRELGAIRTGSRREPPPAAPRHLPAVGVRPDTPASAAPRGKSLGPSPDEPLEPNTPGAPVSVSAVTDLHLRVFRDETPLQAPAASWNGHDLSREHTSHASKEHIFSHVVNNSTQRQHGVIGAPLIHTLTSGSPTDGRVCPRLRPVHFPLPCCLFMNVP